MLLLFGPDTFKDLRKKYADHNNQLLDAKRRPNQEAKQLLKQGGGKVRVKPLRHVHTCPRFVPDVPIWAAKNIL